MNGYHKIPSSPPSQGKLLYKSRGGECGIFWFSFMFSLNSSTLDHSATAPPSTGLLYFILEKYCQQSLQRPTRTCLLLELEEDVGEGLDLAQLLVDLDRLGSAFLRVFAELVLEVLELVTSAPDDLGELLLHLGNVLGKGDLQVVVKAETLRVGIG